VHEVKEGRAQPLPGWSWVRLVIEGEEVQSGDGEWGRQTLAVYVVPDRASWTSADERVTAEFAVHEGRVVCVEVRHRGTREAPVSSGAIRDVRLEDAGRWALLQDAKEELQGRPSTPEEIEARDESAAFFHVEHRALQGERQVREAGRALDQRVKGTRGRPPVPRAELERVAEVYRTSESRPVQAVERVLDLSPSQATRRVQMARKAGLIPPATRQRSARKAKG